MLEARLHEHSSFITLTYDENSIPPGGTLVPKDTQDWLKRLRTYVGPIRYYLVGEYGDQTQRPHYHAALFGVPGCPYQDAQKTRRGCNCPVCQVLKKTWPQGRTHSGELTTQSAQYIAGYVTKKLTSKDDPRLQGRHPEFARMSLRPGIGAGAMVSVGEALNSSSGALSIAATGDVPTALRHERKSLPLGRYLRRKLREELGFETSGGQEKPMAAQRDEVQAMLDASPSRTQYLTFKPFIEHQKILQIEGKAKIFSKKGDI